MKKRMRKRWTSLILTFLMLFSSVNIVFATEDNTWKDIQSYYPFSSWAANIATKYKLIFLEDNKRAATRAEIANLLFNLTSIENVSSGEKTFTDISGINEVLKKRIQKMSGTGIISGYEDGTFRPTNTVTRAEFAAMLCRMDILNKQEENQNMLFDDISDHWAKEDINKIASLGIVSGKGDNKFCPEDTITPQELVVILDRLVNLNCIEKEKVVSTILDTFKSKQYTEKEQYVIEIMYNKFDEIDGFMKYNFPYKKYYDYTNWQEFATAEDIQHIIYFMMSRKTKIQNDEEKAIFNDVGNVVNQKNKSGEGYYTISDMLRIIMGSQIATRTSRASSIFDDKLTPIYTNTQNIDSANLEQIINIISIPGSTIFENVDMEFPIDAPVTKYILNYFAMKIEETYKGYRGAWTPAFNQYIGESKGFVTDVSELPSNYAEYPYIIKGLPKSLYETPYFGHNRYEHNTPSECYSSYSDSMEQVAMYIAKYYSTILNVDYRNLNEEAFKSSLKTCFYYVSDEEIQKYLDYVKENQIILKGTGFAIPGTMYRVGIERRVRTLVNLEIVSAKEMKDLLFGDMADKGLLEPVKYNEKVMMLYPDIEVQGGPILIDGKLRTDMYKISGNSIYSCLLTDGWKKYDYNMPQ